MFVLDELQACLCEPWTVAVKRTENAWEASVSGTDPVVDTCWETGDTASDAIRRLVSFLVTGVSLWMAEQYQQADDALLQRSHDLWRSMTGPERARLDALHERLRREHTAQFEAAAERAGWADEGVTETDRECDHCQHSTRVPIDADRWGCSECGMSNGADVPMWPVRLLRVVRADDNTI